MQEPILVTGAPRSGTTWLARLLATAPGTALLGREPMNPRAGQHALAGNVSGWSRLRETSGSRHHRALRRAYAGRDPRVYGRYGRHQWRAPLPFTRKIIKDPFGMLSLPTIHRSTGAHPVLVYRHPGAVLVSYRRMGWTPDLDELERVVREEIESAPDVPGLSPRPRESLGEVAAMGWFWSSLHRIALQDLGDGGVPATVVSHERLAGGDRSGAESLFASLGLTWNSAASDVLGLETGAPQDPRRLHNFDRSPAQAAVQWRSRLTPAEIEEMEEIAGETLCALDERAHD